jgi:hypothetical protein
MGHEPQIGIILFPMDLAFDAGSRDVSRGHPLTHFLTSSFSSFRKIKNLSHIV